MKDVICKSFFSMNLMSLAMAWAISTNFSFMDIVVVVIIGIVITKEEVKELEWMDELSSFDTLVGDPKCESVLELALAI